MKMKCAIIAFFAVLHCVVGDTKDHDAIQAASMKCIKEMGLEEDKILEYYRDKTGKTDDSQIKCYLKCFMTAVKWMDEAGNMSDRIGEYFVLRDIAEECASFVTTTMQNQPTAEPCEKAYLFNVCFTEKKQAAEQDHHNPH